MAGFKNKKFDYRKMSKYIHFFLGDLEWGYDRGMQRFLASPKTVVIWSTGLLSLFPTATNDNRALG